MIFSAISQVWKRCLPASKLARLSVSRRTSVPIRTSVDLFSSHAPNNATSDASIIKLTVKEEASVGEFCAEPIAPKSAQELPEETLYILDGTAMLFQAYHSREHANRYSKVAMAEPLAEALRAELQLDMTAYRAEFAEATAVAFKRQRKTAKSKASVENMKVPDSINFQGKTAATKEEEDERLFCGALVVMALNFARLVRYAKPRYVAVAFDAGRHTFRNNIYDAYKKNRGKTPLALSPLFKLAPKVFAGLGARCFQRVGFEADDVMASLSLWARQRDLHVVHVSNDKDMLQLVDSHVRILNPTRPPWSKVGPLSPLTGAQEVLLKYRVHPHQFADYLALVGDGADNIPGVKGVGPVQAVGLLTHFGSIEGIIAAMALPAEGVDLDSRASVEAAGMSLVETPVKVKGPRSSQTKAAGVPPLEAAAVETTWEVQFNERALQETVSFLKQAGVQDVSNAAKRLLRKFLTLGATELRLFQTLVRLQADLPLASLVMGEVQTAAELTPEFFSYSYKGEARHNSEATPLRPELKDISAEFDGVAALLRKQYPLI